MFGVAPAQQPHSTESDTSTGTNDRRAFLLHLKGPIGPATAEFVTDSLEQPLRGQTKNFQDMFLLLLEILDRYAPYFQLRALVMHSIQAASRTRLAIPALNGVVLA